MRLRTDFNGAGDAQNMVPSFSPCLSNSARGFLSNSKGTPHFLGGRGSWEGGTRPPLSFGLGPGQPVLSLGLGHAAGLGLPRPQTHSGSESVLPFGVLPQRAQSLLPGAPFPLPKPLKSLRYLLS